MQKAAKTILKQRKPAECSALLQYPSTNFSGQHTNRPALTMADEESKHRAKLPLYDLMPRIENCWVAPNSTVGKSTILLHFLNESLTPCL